MQKLKTSLREHRQQLSMTQDELAERVGVRRETIVHLENGRYNPSLKLALQIAGVFGVAVEVLFWLVEEEETAANASAKSSGKVSPQPKFT